MTSTSDTPVNTSSEVHVPPSRKPSGRLVVVLSAMVGLGLAGFIGVRVKQALVKREEVAKERAAAAALAANRPPVAVTRPKPTMWRPVINVTGTLQPWRFADVGFEQGGRLARVLVSTGDTVKEGQALAFLDAAVAGAQVGQAEAGTRAAEAQLALAEDTLRRTEALAATKSIPEAQLEQVRRQVDLARAQVEGARAQERLARTGAGQRSVAAPFTGLLTRAPNAGGGVVAPGAPLFRVEDVSRFRLAATVGEEDADLVKVGAHVEVRYRDRRVTGKVTTVVPSLDQATRRAPIEVEVPNDPKQPLLAWSFVHATIEGGSEVKALRLPASVRRPGSQNELFVLQDGRAKVVHVVHSVDTDGTWVVRDGLDENAIVLLEPTADMVDGMAIEKTEAK
jgi:RND family efflux transporter MFP subunit